MKIFIIKADKVYSLSSLFFTMVNVLRHATAHNGIATGYDEDVHKVVN